MKDACLSSTLRGDCRRIHELQKAGAKSGEAVLWSGRDSGMGIKWQDEKFEIEYAGTGFAVYRKAQGNRPRHLLRDGFPSLTPAKALVARQYPREVG